MYSILIIEDDKRVADLLKTGLEENGYHTMVAYDGAMGLRLFQSHSFQLVISDIILPKMDGFELCKEICKSNPHIPVLMLTALGSTDDKLDGFDAGADDYMVKPFDFRELNARIKVLYMVQNAERVISRIEIAEKVWNTHFDTGTNFIDVYINYLRKKIDKDFETKLIHTKPGIGFILTDEKP